MPYATVEQLTAYLGVPAPTDAARLLDRASELIRDETRLAVYAVNTAGSPTDATVVDGFADATCAQVEYWLASDEEDAILGPVQGIAVGGMQVHYGAGENRTTPTYLAPRAAVLLRNAGLLNNAVYS